GRGREFDPPLRLSIEDFLSKVPSLQRTRPLDSSIVNARGSGAVIGRLEEGTMKRITVVLSAVLMVAAAIPPTAAQAHILPATLARAYIYNRGLDLADAYEWNNVGSHPRFHIDGCRRYNAHIYFCATTLYFNDPAGLYNDCWYTITASIPARGWRVSTS